MRTRDGVNVSGGFQIAPKTTGLQKSIMSVGQVADIDNIIAFRSSSGTISNERAGGRIEVEAFGGVYSLKADTYGRRAHATGLTKMLIVLGLESAEPAEAPPAAPETVPVLPSESEVQEHELTHLPLRCWCRHCVRAKGKESPRHESSPGGVSKCATDYMFNG